MLYRDQTNSFELLEADGKKAVQFLKNLFTKYSILVLPRTKDIVMSALTYPTNELAACCYKHSLTDTPDSFVTFEGHWVTKKEN